LSGASVGAAMVEFRLLGTLDAGEQGSVALGGRKQRTLLAYLLLHRNEAIPRDTLIDALWPEDPPATAAHALDVYVSRLRKSLGGDGLFETRGGSIRLNVADEAVDAARFEQLVGEARGAESPAARLAALEQALALWRGRALADLLDESSLRPERERLEEERVVAEEERFEAMLALGRHDEAIGSLQSLASEHPLRERPRRLLMLALYRAGRQSEALEVYRAYRRLLSDELGLEPSAELRELEAAVLRHDRMLAAPAPAEVDAAALTTSASAVRVRRTRRRVVTIAAVIVLVAGAIVAALALSGGGNAGPAVTVPDLSAAALDPATGRVVDVVPLHDPPTAALTVGNTVWISSWENRTFTRVDDRTGAVLGSVGLPCHPLALAYGDRRIWIASGDRGCSLTAVDPSSGQVTLKKSLHQPGLGVFSAKGWGANGIAFGSNSVWVTVGVSGLFRLSPSGRVEKRFVIGPAPWPVGAAHGEVWVGILGPERIVEIDPRGDSIGPRVPVGAMQVAQSVAGPVPCSLAVSRETAWVTAGGEGTSTASGIWRVDTVRNVVSGVIHVGGNPCGISLGHGKVWVSNPSNYEVDVIDPLSTNHVRKIALDSPPNAIAVAPRHVWVVTG
jgi:DNA-binding SARP family transcriptional activator